MFSGIPKWVLTSSYIFLDLDIQTCSNASLHIPAYSCVFIHIPTYSNVFLPIPTSSYLFLPIPTNSYLFPHIPTYSPIPNALWSRYSNGAMVYQLWLQRMRHFLWYWYGIWYGYRCMVYDMRMGSHMRVGYDMDMGKIFLDYPAISLHISFTFFPHFSLICF